MNNRYRLPRRIFNLFASAALLLTALSASAGTVNVVGSNTLEPFMKQWAAGLAGKVDVNISSPGTSVGPKALVQGRADVAAMNREMSNDELELFIRQFGYYPTAIVVAIEPVALYVNPANPLPGLDLDQIEDIFAANHGCNWQDRIKTWGQLGLGNEWKNARINLYGHDNKSPVRDFFNRTFLCRDNMNSDMKEMNHGQLVGAIAKDKFGLGFSRFDPSSSLKALPIKKGGEKFVPLTVQTVQDRSYKLQHYLYLYINKPKSGSINSAVVELLKTGLSPQGQAAVSAAGYVPLPADLISRQLGKLE